MFKKKRKSLQDSVAYKHLPARYHSSVRTQNRNKFLAAAQEEFCRIPPKGAVAIGRLEMKERLGVMDE